MTSFSEYIDKTNLPEFIASLGYKLRRDESKNNRYYTLELFDSSHKIEELICLEHRDTNKWIYFNRHNNLDKGNLIDFLRKRNYDYSQINEVLSSFHNDSISSFGHHFSGVSPAKSKISIPQIDWKSKLKPLLAKDYLHDRGFSDLILSKLKGSIFQDDRSNILFPLYNGKMEIVGCHSRNYTSLVFMGNLTLADSNKSDGFWCYMPKNKPSNFLIGEDALDVISCFIINYYALGDDTCLIGCQGNFSSEKLYQIKLLASSFGTETPHFFTCFDNDVPGLNFDLKFLSELNFKSVSPDFEIRSSISSQSISSDFKPLSEKNSFSSFEKKIKSFFSLHKKENLILSKINSFQLQVPYNRDNFIFMCKLLADFNFSENQVSVFKSNSKDFNQDLMNIKNLNKAKLIKCDPKFYKQYLDHLNTKALSLDGYEKQKVLSVIDELPKRQAELVLLKKSYQEYFLLQKKIDIHKIVNL